MLSFVAETAETRASGNEVKVFTNHNAGSDVLHIELKMIRRSRHGIIEVSP